MLLANGLGVLFLIRIFLNLVTLFRKDFLIFTIGVEIISFVFNFILIFKYLPKCKEVFIKMRKMLIMNFIFSLLSSIASIASLCYSEKCIIMFVLMLFLSVHYGKYLYVKIDVPKKQVYSKVIKILPIHRYESIIFSMEGDRARIIYINKENSQKTTISVDRKRICQIPVKDESRIEKIKIFSVKENIFGQREEMIENIFIKVFIADKSVE